MTALSSKIFFGLRMKKRILVSFFLCLLPAILFAQAQNNLYETLNQVQWDEELMIDNLVRIGSIQSPSGQEHQRASEVYQLWLELGWDEDALQMTDEPNVIATLKGKSDSTIVVVSTLDDLKQIADYQAANQGEFQIKGDSLIAPGMNTSLTTIALIHAAIKIKAAQAVPDKTWVFASVAQEETGLQGMKALVKKYEDTPSFYIDLLGSATSVSYGGLGIHWYRIDLSGRGAHTLRGNKQHVNRAMSKAVARILDLDYPEKYQEERTFINIAKIQAGSVFNHQPENAWFSLDIRSLQAHLVEKVLAEVSNILEEETDNEGVSFTITEESITPGGQILGFKESKEVQTILRLSEFLHQRPPNVSNAGSSNMNIPISMNIPAVGLGSSRGGRRGYPDEWASIRDLVKSAQIIYLISQHL
ncbi:MAG: M20/M25/M40 family metallo-hydrolase [Cyclobacteriaceae bacterium]|nr:M20/M25/M40 family metallo-hydrolase [Cyclobacteriaceae bacterium]MCH8514883.1 M20/M25/M40 family metallo-hydrolase [Cyclobacteriaceae bacterium]